METRSKVLSAAAWSCLAACQDGDGKQAPAPMASGDQGRAVHATMAHDDPDEATAPTPAKRTKNDTLLTMAEATVMRCEACDDLACARYLELPDLTLAVDPSSDEKKKLLGLVDRWRACLAHLSGADRDIVLDLLVGGKLRLGAGWMPIAGERKKIKHVEQEWLGVHVSDKIGLSVRELGVRLPECARPLPTATSITT